MTRRLRSWLMPICIKPMVRTLPCIPDGVAGLLARVIRYHEQQTSTRSLSRQTKRRPEGTAPTSRALLGFLSSLPAVTHSSLRRPCPRSRRRERFRTVLATVESDVVVVGMIVSPAIGLRHRADKCGGWLFPRAPRSDSPPDGNDRSYNGVSGKARSSQ
jgi:hypothetical protein